MLSASLFLRLIVVSCRWSHPIEVEVAGNTRRYLAVPVRRLQGSAGGSKGEHGHLRRMTTMRRPSVPCWDLHDGRVADDGHT